MDQEILTEINKEKFRRRLLILSRYLAVGLIIAIIWIGFVQINYVKELNKLRSDYGSLAYCYMCGLENGRRCECQYIPENALIEFNREEYLQGVADYNIQECVNPNQFIKIPNIT